MPQFDCLRWLLHKVGELLLSSSSFKTHTHTHYLPYISRITLILSMRMWKGLLNLFNELDHSHLKSCRITTPWSLPRNLHFRCLSSLSLLLLEQTELQRLKTCSSVFPLLGKKKSLQLLDWPVQTEAMSFPERVHILLSDNYLASIYNHVFIKKLKEEPKCKEPKICLLKDNFSKKSQGVCPRWETSALL